MVMWLQLQIKIASRLAQDQEVGPGGYPLRPTWTTLHPEGTSGSKTVFFPHLSTQYNCFKGKGVHGPKVSLDSQVPNISAHLPSVSELRWDGGRRDGERCKQRFAKAGDSPSSFFSFPQETQRSQYDHDPILLLVHISYSTKCSAPSNHPNLQVSKEDVK